MVKYRSYTKKCSKVYKPSDKCKYGLKKRVGKFYYDEYHKPGGERCVVVWLVQRARDKNNSLRKPRAQDITEFLKLPPHVVLVSDKNSYHVVDTDNTRYEQFTYAETQFNPLCAADQPSRFEVISEPPLPVDRLPKIRRNDVVPRFLGCCKGEVLGIVYKDACLEDYYRHVI